MMNLFQKSFQSMLVDQILQRYSLALVCVRARYCYRPFCPSVCPSVTLVSHADTVQNIEIYLTLYETAMFLVF